MFIAKTKCMKTIISCIVFFFFFLSHAQKTYWQQRVDYSILATVKDASDQLVGEETLIYENNSPDTLKEVYFHLYWNAFKKESHAFEDNKIGSSAGVDFGEMNIESIVVDNELHNMQVFESIGQVKLKKYILPGNSCTLKIRFNSIIPSCINRAGKDNNAGTDYTYTQWYPKICRYDQMGWHTDPYFGREFAGTFGKYNVEILCDKSFVVAGTGQLLNKKYTENDWEETAGEKQQNGLVSWKFYGENIHDFAFAMDKDWIHKNIKIDDISFNFFYHEDYSEMWESLMKKWPKAYEICKTEFGKYPYPQFSFIQAGEGYMEYPMCTMLESSRSDFFNTACHEFMHNYFYGIFGTDENLYHWMDEGITCYAEERISNINGSANNPASGAISNYKWISSSYDEEPISTAANHFSSDYPYYNAAYFKGQLFPEIIRYMIGDSLMQVGFSRYYAKWKFKHPEPNDFVKTFEDVSQMELTWFQNYWLNTTKKIDFSIDTVSKQKDGIKIRFTKQGIPMPLEFSIKLKNGKVIYYYIPLDLTNNIKTNFNRPTQVLEKWSCGSSAYEFTLKDIKLREIEEIKLDPDSILPDFDQEKNLYQTNN
jgi:hypothetical protein